MAGTSVAAAQVTGAASLVWEANPGLNYRQVIEVLKSNATDLNTVGWNSLGHFLTYWRQRGDDKFYGGTGDDKAYGGDDNDDLRGDEGNADLRGEKGNDSLYGVAGKDSLYGGEGNDEIRGEQEVDYLRGDTGNDLLYGGKGLLFELLDKINFRWLSLYNTIYPRPLLEKSLGFYKLYEKNNRTIFIYSQYKPQTGKPDFTSMKVDFTLEQQKNFNQINRSFETNVAIFKASMKFYKEFKRKFQNIGSNNIGKNYFYTERTKAMVA